MTGTLDGLGHFLLELLRSTGQTAGQNLTLLVQKLLEKFRVLVIHILDTCLLETAIFFFRTSTVTGLRYLISDCCALGAAMVYSSSFFSTVLPASLFLRFSEYSTAYLS